MAIRKKEVAVEEVENTELTLSSESLKRHKRPRRSDAELEKELKMKLQKVQERIARQNEKIYFDMGFLMCQIANIDINELPDEDKEEITNKTEKGKQIVKSIMGLAGLVPNTKVE